MPPVRETLCRGLLTRIRCSPPVIRGYRRVTPRSLLWSEFRGPEVVSAFRITRSDRHRQSLNEIGEGCSDSVYSKAEVGQVRSDGLTLDSEETSLEAQSPLQSDF
jgi:hypothetical protein